jgi:hypothetical protein
MKRWTTILAMAAMLVIAVGCRQRTKRPERVGNYDPELDGQVAAMRPVDVEMELLEDQTGVRAPDYSTSPGQGRSGSAAGQSDTGGGVSAGDVKLVPVGDNPIPEAKTAYQRLRETAQGQDPAKLAAHYDRPEAMAFGWLKNVEGTDAALETIKEAVEEGSLTLPESFKVQELEQMFSQDRQPGRTGSMADFDPIEDVSFEKEGDRVLAKTSDGSTTVVFVPRDGMWKAQLPGMARGFALPMVAMVGRSAMMVKEIAAGIRSGEINESNAERKLDQIQQAAQEDIDRLTSLLQADEPGGGGATPPPPPPEDEEPMRTPAPPADDEDHGDDEGDDSWGSGDDDSGWGSGDGWN